MYYNFWAEDLLERTEYQCKNGYFDHLLKEKPKNMTGIELISQERQEQLTKHNRSVEGDKQQNFEFQLADAATALIAPIPEGMEENFVNIHKDYPPIGWNHEDWERMLKKPYKERLIISGALIAAEIDRIS